MKAMWNNAVIAESNSTEIVDEIIIFRLMQSNLNIFQKLN